VTDATNFQPEVTLRNAIRKMLKDEDFNSGATVGFMNLVISILLMK